MKTLFLNMKKILAKDVTDFSHISHSTFNWESLKRLLRILKKRNPSIMALNFPEGMTFDDVLEFWLDNCYPGTFAGYACNCNKDVIEGYIEDNPDSCRSYYELTDDNDCITEKEETLAVYYLKESI